MCSSFYRRERREERDERAWLCLDLNVYILAGKVDREDILRGIVTVGEGDGGRDTDREVD